MSESRSNYVNKGSDSFSFNVQDSKSGSDESLRLGEALSLNSSSRELGNDNLYEVEKNVRVDEKPNTEVDSGSDSGGSTNSGKRTYKAALRLQKVYRSFRTRRQLADCAVIIEQKWWKVLDLAELKRSSISFFDIEKHESALSKWSRARTKAAKVGKGLSKDEKARKLALQHWLEAIDPRHRYGHNLQFYYVKWLHCDSSQPFFYWLDIGEGREVDLEICGRSKLLHQCIKYLGPNEREVFEVMVLKGRFFYKKCRSLIDTTAQPKGTKWIFVLSTCKKLYVAQKVKGTFQHSSFLAGGATLSAGRLVVQDGYLTAVWPHSGHYLPTEENFQAFMSFLVEHEVDLTHVQKSPMEEEEESGHKKEIAQMVLSQFKREASRKWEIKDQKRNEAVEKSSSGTADSSDDSSSGYETAEESFLTEVDFTYPKTHIFSDDEDDEFKDAISQEMIFKRINTHRRTKSYQLADQLNSKWTTGAGPRIGCVRDYPSTLQFQAMDHVNLSPRGVRCLNSPGSASLGLRRDLFKVRSPLAFAPDMPSPLASLSEFHSPLSSDFPKDVEFPD